MVSSTPGIGLVIHHRRLRFGASGGCAGGSDRRGACRLARSPGRACWKRPSAAMNALGARSIAACVGPLHRPGLLSGRRRTYTALSPPPTPAPPVFFRADGPDHWRFDLPAYCAARLTQAGVAATQLHLDTCADPKRFFSHRRRTLAGGAARSDTRCRPLACEPRRLSVACRGRWPDAAAIRSRSTAIPAAWARAWPLPPPPRLVIAPPAAALLDTPDASSFAADLADALADKEVPAVASSGRGGPIGGW